MKGSQRSIPFRPIMVGQEGERGNLVSHVIGIFKLPLHKEHAIRPVRSSKIGQADIA